MKISKFIVALSFLLAFIGLSALHIPAQSTTELFRRCPGVSPSPASGKIQIDAQGNIRFNPCATKKVYINGVEISTDGTDFTSQPANWIFAAPNGSSGNPVFRAMVADDVPLLPASKIVTGKFDAARLGSGTANADTFLNGDGNWATIDGSKIGAGSISPARLGAGTANSTTYLSGDGNWKTLAPLSLTHSLTGSGSTSLLNLSPIWNTSADVDALSLDVTNTASGAASNLLNLKTGGVSKFRVTPAGGVLAGGIFEIKPTLTGSNGTNEALFSMSGALVSGTSNQDGILANFATSGNGTRPFTGLRIQLLEGYGGNKGSTVINAFNNVSTSSATSFGIKSGVDNGGNNFAPRTIGLYAWAKDADQSTGIVGSSVENTHPGLIHVGVSGFALNGTVNAAGYFSLYDEDTDTNTNFGAALNSAAIIATNGTTGADIFNGYEGNNRVFRITPNGSAFPKSLILKSDDATCWQVTITDAGVLTPAEITCP